MKKWILSSVLLCSFLLTGCGISISPIVNGEKFESNDVKYATVGDTFRFIDKEAGVVCWKYMQGISCLPISETKLGENK